MSPSQRIMRTSNRRIVYGVVISVIIILVVWDVLRNPGPEDLQGDFTEIAFVRNEQNKGGIVRIYAFYVGDTVGADYQGCGDLLPHNDYGSMTKVYFFKKGQPVPESLRLEPPHFDTLRYRPVALYTKGEDGVGRVSSGR